MNTRNKTRNRATTSATVPVRFAVGGALQPSNESRRAARSDSEAGIARSPSVVPPSRIPTPTLTGEEGGGDPTPVADRVVEEQVAPASLERSAPTVVQRHVVLNNLNNAASDAYIGWDTSDLNNGWSTNDNDLGWTTVPRRRALSPRGGEMSSRNEVGDANIEKAFSGLTKTQKERFVRSTNRFSELNTDLSDDSDEESNDKENDEPLQSKGKGVDPSNWGNVGLSPEEMDVSAQRKALKELKVKKTAHKGRSGAKKQPKASTSRYVTPVPDTPHFESADKTRKGRKTKQLVAEVRPVTQIPKNSYLGAAFKQVKAADHKGKRKRSPSSPESSDSSSDAAPDDGDDESSDPSDSGSSSSESYDDSSDDDDDYPRRKGKRSRKRKRSRSPRKAKPIAPRDYDGRENPRAFHRFMKESINYLEDAKVKRKRYAYTLSRYLTGRAYNYYTQKVALTEEKWSLDEFFQGMFNYCFPANYRTKLRAKLDKLSQNANQTVTEFIYELEELCNLIGEVSERDRVIRLWNGLRSELQRALWRDKLSPETSSWEAVVAQAETIEISHNVATGYSQSIRKGSDGRRTYPRRTYPPENLHKDRRRSKDRQSNAERFPKREDTSSKGKDWRARRYKSESRPDFKGKRPENREKERTKQVAEGRCFVCDEAGHFSRNCPKANSMKGKGGKPPGLSTFNAEITLHDDASDGSVEVLESLPLGAMFYRYSDGVETGNFHGEPKSIRLLPAWMERHSLPRSRIGNVYCLQAEYVLTVNQPYFGDERYEDRWQAVSSRRRMNISKGTSQFYYVEDELTEFQVKLHRRFMENPDFNLADWYNKKRTYHFNQDTTEDRTGPETRMGDAPAIVARHLLEDGIDAYYPNVSPPADRPRFHLSKAKAFSDEYLIKDLDLEKETIVWKELLTDPSFNLVSWYSERINAEGLYNTCYDREMVKLQSAIIDTLRSQPSPLTELRVQPLEVDKLVADLYSNPETHSSMPGLRPISESNWSDDDKEIPFVPYDYVDDKRTPDVNDESANNFESREEKIKELWNAVLKASERKVEVESVTDASEHEDLPRLDDSTSAVLLTCEEDVNGNCHTKTNLEYPNLEAAEIGTSDIEEDSWSIRSSEIQDDSPETHQRIASRRGNIGDPMGKRLNEVLTRCQPYPGDPPQVSPTFEDRFNIYWDEEQRVYEVFDTLRMMFTYLHRSRLDHHKFSVGRWFAERCARKSGHLVPWYVAVDWLANGIVPTLIGKPVEERIESTLELGTPYKLDSEYSPRPGKRFLVCSSLVDHLYYHIMDNLHGMLSFLPKSHTEIPVFNLCNWYEHRMLQYKQDRRIWSMSPVEDVNENANGDVLTSEISSVSILASGETHELTAAELRIVEAHAAQVDRNKYAALQRSSATAKDKARVLPKPVVLQVLIHGHLARALVDSGSQGDFLSSVLSDQLHLNKLALPVPLKLQLAVQGSRSVIKHSVESRFQFQGIDEIRKFDVVNLSNYDLILGTPWLYQHQVCVGFNPARITIGSDRSLPVVVNSQTKPLANAVTYDPDIEAAREELKQYAEPLCKDEKETGLPPLRAINHTIPLIDEGKVYPWRPSRCPEVFRSQWAEKRDAYLKTGRWEITSAGNTVPMLLVQKPKKDSPELRVVVDLRERNKNTHKMTSPLPDMEGVLRRTARRKFRTALDLKAAYEQIRIVPEHVQRTAVTTPDGNMVSHVVQQGDCNAPATYQALMNHLFSAHIGRIMDVYLDDIVIYSDSLDQHVKDVKIILDILKREKLYLSKNKLRFIAPEIDLLGRIIDDNGIRMDPNKVNCVVNWKTPTNRDLLRGFLGSVGYLADDIPNIRIPMGVLSALTGDTVPFRWTYTEQRAFEDVKRLVEDARTHRRMPIDYSSNAPQIWMTTDGSSTGISGLVSQGPEWKNAKVAAFYSAKLNSAQQNYPVHEIEMLAGIETMLRHADILQGVKFKWVTDHKGLLHLLNQKNLSGRQARWIEKISSFHFEVVYVPGAENVLADALSRMYSDDSPKTARAKSEYTYHDIVNDDMNVQIGDDSALPTMTSLESAAVIQRQPRKGKEVEPAETGRPETAKEFAARVKDHFVLKGPGERKEGGNRAQTTQPQKLTIRIDPRKIRPPVQPAPDLIANEQTLRVQQIPPITLPQMLSEDTNGINLIEEIKGRFAEDQLFKKVLDDPKAFRNFTVKDGLIYLKEQEKELLCIPKVMISERSAREIIISEAHSMLAHLGPSKTLNYLRDHVWWKEMVTDTQAFCNTCVTCKRSKPTNQKPYGLLNPLSVPDRPWESIGVDFVGPLPVSQNRDGNFDSITVVICLFSAMVHLIPSRANYNAKQVAEMMFEEVYKHHGVPRHIVSDRDSLFTSTFWSHLHELIGTQLKMSSAYHPQTDGSTERANRTVTQMLRQCVDGKQTDWVSKLPAIEFAINSARSESTGYSPFFINSGTMPRAMIWDNASKNEYPTIRNFALQKKLAIMSAHDSILAARVKQSRQANRKRQPVPFKDGDLVYISTKNMSFPKGLARKLVPKFIGPYRITKDFGNFSFRVELPAQMSQRGIHNVFHASLLRIHVPNDDRLFPGRLESQVNSEIEPEGEWAVERIVSHAGTGVDAVFEVKWKAGDTTWLPYDQVSHLQALASYLDLLDVPNISALKAGFGVPPENDPQIYAGQISPYQSNISYLTEENSPATSPSDSSFCILPSDLSDLSSDSPMTRFRKSNHRSSEGPQRAPRSHPNFLQSGQRVVVRDDVGNKTFSLAVVELQHCLEIDELARSGPTAQSALEQARMSPLYESVARSFNAIASPRQFAIIDTEKSEITVPGEPVSLTDFGILPNSVNAPTSDRNSFTPEQMEVVNSMLREAATHQYRRKSFAIAEREKKRERAQLSRAADQLKANQGRSRDPPVKVNYQAQKKGNKPLAFRPGPPTTSGPSHPTSSTNPHPAMAGVQTFSNAQEVIAHAVAAHEANNETPVSLPSTPITESTMSTAITDEELQRLMQEPSTMEVDPEFSLEAISELDIMNNTVSCATLSMNSNPTLEFRYSDAIAGGRV